MFNDYFLQKKVGAKKFTLNPNQIFEKFKDLSTKFEPNRNRIRKKKKKVIFKLVKNSALQQWKLASNG